MLRIIFVMLLTFAASFGYAKDSFSPLPADEAFVLSVHFNQTNQLVLDWKMAPGYYLYRSQITVTSDQAELGKIAFPNGTIRKDLIHGIYTSYFNKLEILVPILNASASHVEMTVRYQGCSSKGFCYAPIQKTLDVDVPNSAVSIVTSADKPTDFSQMFSHHNWFLTLISFLGLGLLLAFTPCVLPMVPILSAIILGHGKSTNKSKAFFLSLAYVLGMAITYAAAGVVVALIGSSIQADLERPWVLILFSAVFVLLALSLFDVYALQLPSAWQRRINVWSSHQKSGTYIGVFFMGSLSTLIVSPCVSAPLVGVLAYIGKTGDVVFGALSLLAMGIGMGIPLLLLGISADKWLPRAGRWMVVIERLFGVLMLITAVWMLSRLIPVSPTQTEKNYFTVIHSTQEFNQRLEQAKKSHQPVMLDFYADWCSSCVVMNHRVFSRDDVKSALSSFVLLQVDVTANNKFDQAISKQFHVIGPPTMLFFVQGKEMIDQRIIGEVNAKDFLVRVKAITQVK